MGRVKTLGGVLLILLGESLIYLYIYPLFLINLFQAWIPSILLIELTNSMSYLIYMFLVFGIIAMIAGIYFVIRGKFPPKSKSTPSYYYSG